MGSGCCGQHARSEEPSEAGITGVGFSDVITLARMHGAELGDHLGSV